MDETMRSEEPTLLVRREEFLKALNLLQRAIPISRRQEVILSYDEANLHVDVAGATIAVPAVGTWPGQARVPAAMLQMFRRVPPPGDPFTFTIRGDHIHVGSMSFTCAWQGPWSSLIQLPVNYDRRMLVAIGLKYTAEQIRESGLERLVGEARSRFCAHIERAAKPLEQYGITDDDLMEYVTTRIREDEDLMHKI